MPSIFPTEQSEKCEYKYLVFDAVSAGVFEPQSGGGKMARRSRVEARTHPPEREKSKRTKCE